MFLSWSGHTSRLVADALRDWLPNVVQSIEPWLSAQDIPYGTQWYAEVSERLETSSAGIICLTRENLSAIWLNYEAGALARSQTIVCPYLLDLKPSEIAGPLSQFQCAQANREDTYRLLLTLNKSSETGAVSEPILQRAFELHWPSLEARLNDIRRVVPQVEPNRSIEDKIDEVLVLLRELSSERSSDPAKPGTERTKEMSKPRVFIGSSTEGLAVAELIQLGLEHAVECTLWTQSSFTPGQTTIESIVDLSVQYDFAILILTPDDLLLKRGGQAFAPRDNILFELGLFTGALGRARTFMVYGREETIHLPSDLAGVTAVTYSKRSDGNLEAALGPVCTRIKRAMGVA